MEREQVQLFEFEGNNVPVKFVNDQLMFDAETVGKSVGLTTVAKSGNVVVRWNRFNKYLGNGATFGAGDFITESQMYRLAIKANNKTAERFQDWVTDEVLPSIRKNGVYMTDKKAYDITHNSDGLAELLLQAGNQLKAKDLVIREMKPKALFADSVATSHSTILIGELAKIMRGNGIDIGANRLFGWLRQKGYLISRRGSDWNMPTQKAMDQGLFKIKETSISHSDGTVSISKTTKVTGKGQQYFINKFLA
ncbi:phage antirepressor KilAC domain-containing protein [Pediococcus pentosaceus]|uniref:phage antirepressor n=1 Tax=Pediococcus pentosaceus TaxID=1255 RepID=UPI0031624C05